MQQNSKENNHQTDKEKSDYQAAMNRLEVIFDASPGTAEGDELEVLGILIEKYEEGRYSIGYPDPIEAIKFRMEQLGYSQSDLAEMVGLKARASEILSKKRKLTRNDPPVAPGARHSN